MICPLNKKRLIGGYKVVIFAVSIESFAHAFDINGQAIKPWL
jgi:hypothetical protein